MEGKSDGKGLSDAGTCKWKMREKMEALRERKRSSEQTNCEKFTGGKMKMHLKNIN